MASLLCSLEVAAGAPLVEAASALGEAAWPAAGEVEFWTSDMAVERYCARVSWLVVVMRV